jgi:hypothetical protein
MTPVAASHQRLFRNGLALLYRGQAMSGKLVIINNSCEHGDKDGGLTRPRNRERGQSRKATDCTDVMSNRFRQRRFLHIITSSLRSM